MKAMVLAAGLGTRLQPLTLEVPKPLLEAGGRSLIEYQLDRLATAGVTEVVINLHHLGDRIERVLGNGTRFGLNITYSKEAELLETGGGIVKALPLLGNAPFLCISGDTYSGFDLRRLPESLPPGSLGLMVMADNPVHHPAGDFLLAEDGGLHLQDASATGRVLTYTGTAIFSPELVRGEPEQPFALRGVLDRAIAAGRMYGLHYDGYWCDVGTSERLEELRLHLNQKQYNGIPLREE